jgi:hypothetical protein
MVQHVAVRGERSPGELMGVAAPHAAERPGAAPIAALQSTMGNRVLQLFLRRGPGDVEPAPEAALAGLADRSPGRPLEQDARHDMERRFGTPLGDVRVHDDAGAARLATGLGASAFARDRDIYFAAGLAHFNTALGRRVLAHEVAHVVQQRAPSSPGVRLVSRPGDASEVGAERAAGHMALERPLAPGSSDAMLQRQAAAPNQAAATGAEAGVAAGTGSARPVMWGLDITVRPFASYVSVAPPGHTVDEVATYMYGDAAASAQLRATNGALRDPLPPGSVLRPTGQPLTKQASDDLNGAIRVGTILRTQGTQSQESAVMYRFTVAGTDLSYTEPQFLALLRGMATYVKLRATYVKDMAIDGRKVHADFKSENDWSAVRWTSDLLGGVSIPDPGEVWDPVVNDSQRLVDRIAGYEPGPGTQGEVASAGAELFRLNQQLADAQYTWHHYLDATISGAETAVHYLELTRNVSFGVVAGLAGAVAAPAVFAAIGATTVVGTLGATVAAVGAGAGAGGLVRGGLEVVLPGANQQVTGARFVSGFESGAIQGGLGAAGALAAPGVAGVVSKGLYGAAPQALTTTGARLSVNVLTGAALGLPSGAAASGIENIGAFRLGEISGGQFWGRVGLGGATGMALGGVTSVIPIQGLYPKGGIPFAEPVSPRFMYAGPFSPLQVRAMTDPGFHALSPQKLPPLPDGYAWIRLNSRWEPMSMTGRFTGSPFEATWYGQFANRPGNFVLNRAGGRIFVQAGTRPAGVPSPGGARDPGFQQGDFNEPGGQSYDAGHGADYADRPTGPGTRNSNLDPNNFAPEPAWWNRWLRNNLAARIRRTGGGYQQVNYWDTPSGASLSPPTTPRLTNNGTPIPDGCFFIETDAGGNVVAAWRIPFTPTGPTTQASLGPFAIPSAQLPGVVRSVAPWLGVAGAAAAPAGGQVGR